MNIALDSIAQLGPMSKNRGIGNYADSQFRTLLKLDQENNYFFFNVFDEADVFWEEIGSGRVQEDDFLCTHDGSFIDIPGFREFYGELIGTYLKRNKIDVFYITSPFDIHIPPYSEEWFEGVKVVATVYDIIPYVMRDHYFPGKHDIDWYMERIEMLRWVDRLLVISQSVKDDLVNYLKFDADKIDVIWGAPSEMFKEIPISAKEERLLREKFNITGQFVMCTGGDDDRKNISGLIQAFARLPKGLLEYFQLVIVCKLQQASVERYSALARENGIGDRVILTNFVTDKELLALYNLADLVAFPSVYEGFGLPVVEAWACGTGVVTSNNSSLGQIAGEAAIVVDPHSQKDITRGLKLALEGDLKALAEMGRERLAMFTWDKVASRTKASIEKNVSAVRKEKREECAAKKAIAFFTPLPPLESGISDYSEDIIGALSDYFDIDVFVDEQYTPKVHLPDNVTLLSHKKFEQLRKKYCETVFQMGNSLYHVYMWKYIQKWGGLLVLHDYNMHGVVQAKTLVEKRNTQQYRKILEEDLDVVSRDKCMSGIDNWQMLDVARTKYELNGFVTNHATKIIVHSDEAKEKLLERNIGRNVRRIRHYAKILPPVELKKAKAKIGIPEGKIVLAAFGHVHETKRAIPILRAFSMLAKEQDNLLLILGGKMDASLETPFKEEVARLGLEEKVQVTGYLDLQAFLDYMDATDICLNLRWPYNGETSGSLMRMLAKGKCILVNDMGSFSEIPDDCCVKLPSVEYMSERQEVMEIYEALKLLCCDREKREEISVNARKYAEEELDLRIIAKQYAEYILEDAQKTVTEDLIAALRDEITRLGMQKKDILRLARTLAYVKI